jgi:SAM-dependent methyltransferase
VPDEAVGFGRTRSRIKLALRKLKRGLGSLRIDDHVEFERAFLPPPQMRCCGAKFRDHETFLASGLAEARRVRCDFGVDRHSRLLEIGCGPGRLPIGILSEFGDVARYDGVDVDVRAIRWCKAYIGRKHPRFCFHHVDARHARYNPDGEVMDDDFRLPFPDQDYDLVYLHSVFSNMEPDDVRVYAKEFRRLLNPAGMVFLTAFVEEGVPPVTLNPQDYVVQPTGPLHVARYEKCFFLGLLIEAGLDVVHFGHGTDLGGQSVVHLRRAT